MSEVSNVSAGKPKIGGAVFRAPLGTTAPTDATTNLGTAFKALGYCNEDGLVNSNSITTDAIKAWGGDTVLVTSTDVTDTFQFTAIESKNIEVLKAFYGDDNVTGDLTTGITVSAKVADLPAAVYVFELVLRDGALKRIVLPNAKLSERGDISYVDGQPIGYSMTLFCMPATSGGATHTEYIKAAATAATSN